MESVITGVIPDMQFPGHIDGSLEFIQRTFDKYKVSRVVCIGDLIDHHYIGFHQNEVDAPNSEQEWELTMMELERWVKAFPKVYCCTGNHDERPDRVAAAQGMSPKKFLKSINDVYNLPDSWFWDTQWDFDNVLYEHGLGSNGMYGCKNTAIKLGTSYVQGHTHAHAAVFDIPQFRRNICAMNVGCLMDINKYNARYGRKFFKIGMSLGCGIVENSTSMKFVPYGG